MDEFLTTPEHVGAGRLQLLPGDSQYHTLGSKPSAPITESMIVVHLGPLDGAQDRRVFYPVLPNESEDGLAIEVSIAEGSGNSCVLDLPASDDTVYTPCIFSSPRIDRARLVFKILRRVDSTKQILGVGTVLIKSCFGESGQSLENVERRHFTALHDFESFEYVGSAAFYLQIVKPYAGPTAPPSKKPPPFDFDMRIGGHRGLGQNKKEWKLLQMGENTVCAFEEGSRLGASFVEFDVQVTKDRVPVIYHDFLVNETGTDAVMHNLSYEQFRYLSEAQFSHSRREKQTADDLSLRQPQIEDFTARLSHTLEYKSKGFKANTRGLFIQDSFNTLEQTLRQVNPSLPFDIEIKYPMPFECRAFDISTIWIELNLFLDTILNVVFTHAGDRPIIFSSFSPELCIALSAKQDQYPVYFLTDAVAGVDDLRAGRLGDAVRFARTWGLPGIVTESTPVIEDPGVVLVIHEHGLKCATYGAKNNDPRAVQVQLDAGVDGVCVDQVALISQSCRREHAGKDA